MLQTMALTVLAACAGAGPDDYPNGKLLQEPADWVKGLDSPRADKHVRILDARSREQYKAGHVPGALWVDHNVWSKKFRDEQTADTWNKLVGGLGIDIDTPVVVYDDNGTNAARIWWILRYWGVKNVRLLNGGWTGWKAATGNVGRIEPAVITKEAKLAAEAGRLASKSDILKLLKDKKSQIVDVRTKEEFCGEDKKAKRSGAIPSALHLEWKEAIDPKTKRLKPASELKKLLADAGIDPDRPAITYCQSGGRAAMMAFTLELMGAKDVRNYYRSWSEWGNDAETPIVVPKK